MTGSRQLPPHLTEDDVRAVSEIVVPAVMAEAWRVAANSITDSSTPQSIRAMLHAMAEGADARNG